MNPRPAFLVLADSRHDWTTETLRSATRHARDLLRMGFRVQILQTTMDAADDLESALSAWADRYPHAQRIAARTLSSIAATVAAPLTTHTAPRA